jgi:hypothetical protein
MQQFCASHKRDTTHFSRKKNGCMGGRIANKTKPQKIQAVILDHKETYESCFQDAKLPTTSNTSHALAFIS